MDSAKLGYFSPAGLLRGFIDHVAMGSMLILPFGLAFGASSSQATMPADQSILMSAFVFAGASQFAVMGIWGATVPLLPLILITLTVNARLFVMSAALSPWFRHASFGQRYFSAALLSDGLFATGMAAYNSGERDVAYFTGAGIVMWLCWVVGILAGLGLGATIDDPNRFALDCIMIAFFAVLLARSHKGRLSVIPWTAAALVALAASEYIGGNYHVVLGALAGGIAGAFPRTEAPAR
jgi:4-azaleucine resistance transporter AzlC